LIEFPQRRPQSDICHHQKPAELQVGSMHDKDLAQTEPTLRWPDFGRTTLNDKGRQRKTLRAILAGQPPCAQVAGTRGTAYGTEG
jgi:hypothetical protein